jgi:hypothetical protein
MKINSSITREALAAQGGLNIMVDQVAVDSEADLVDQVVSKDIMEVGALENNKVDSEGVGNTMVVEGLAGLVNIMEAGEVSVDHKADLEDREVGDREGIKVEGDLVDKADQGAKVDLEADGKGVGTQ